MLRRLGRRVGETPVIVGNEVNAQAQLESFSLGASAQTMLAGAVLSTFQAADGILTSLGISRFGIAMEGNPLLRQLMVEFGHIPTLAVVKILAILLIIGLVIAARQFSWIRFALGGLTCFYMCAAILPWTYLLFFTPHA
jgi:hypothetical protein